EKLLGLLFGRDATVFGPQVVSGAKPISSPARERKAKRLVRSSLDARRLADRMIDRRMKTNDARCSAIRFGRFDQIGFSRQAPLHLAAGPLGGASGRPSSFPSSLGRVPRLAGGGPRKSSHHWRTSWRRASQPSRVLIRR